MASRHWGAQDGSALCLHKSFDGIVAHAPAAIAGEVFYVEEDAGFEHRNSFVKT